MKARKLIEGASFSPDAIQVMRQAFDKAWAEVAGNFGNDNQDIEKARMRLAEALISVARNDSRDVQALKNDALQSMALGYRRPREHSVA